MSSLPSTDKDSSIRKRFPDEQIIGILREAEVGAMSIKAMCKKYSQSERLAFRWPNKLCGLNVPDDRRLKSLDSESARFKRPVAEQMPVISGMREIFRNG